MATIRIGQAAFLSVLFLLVGCDSGRVIQAQTETATPTGTPTGVQTSTSTPTLAPTLTSTPGPSFSFKVLSYNIFYGAGVERQFDSALPPEMVGKSRLPDLLSVIKAANPDIVGLQEANGWDRGTPPVISQVAQQLGMNQFLARTASGFYVGLMTKFTILDAENLSSIVGRQGVIKATLLSPKGERLYVFVVHLDPSSSDARLCEVNTLVQQMQPYAPSRVILFGDMNFRPFTREYLLLEQAGYQSVAVEPNWGIDQIWISSAVRWTNSSWFHSLPTPSAISDHNPIGAEIDIYSAPALGANNSIALPSTPATTTTPTPISTPILVADALAGVRTLRRERFDDPCVSSRWNLGVAPVKFADGKLVVTGVEPWQSLVSRHKEFPEGEGIVLRFQPSRDSEFEFYFDNSGWNTDLYRRFGVDVRGNSVQAILWQGNKLIHGENLSNNPRLVPNTWYTLLLAVGKDGDLIAQLWDPADPGQSHRFREKLGDLRTELPWVFGIDANKGQVSIDNFVEIAFSDIR